MRSAESAQASPVGPTEGPAGTAVDPYALAPDESVDLARRIVERHRSGKQKRRHRDLTAEMYAMHIHGANDGQYAEIVNGQAVIVPPAPGTGLRLQQNLLRPMVTNMVAYHTATPHQVIDPGAMGRRSRDEARVNTLNANHIIRDQDLNAIGAEASFVAAAYGSCPIHTTWRYDYAKKAYLPPGYSPDGEGESAEGIQPGFVDIWVGDPWDTVYNDGATRGSIHWASYGRTLPIELVLQTFSHVPGIEQLKGKDNLPSSARFHRIFRRWHYLNQYFRESATMTAGRNNDELIALVCKETAPGFDPRYPEGLLEIVAVNGETTTDRWSSGGNGGTPVLLHRGPLPASQFSFELLYSLYSMDDVLGKPYVADLDELQIQLNQTVTLRAERLRRYSRPQLAARVGAFEEDTVVGDPDSVLFYNSPELPKYLDPPQGNPDYDASIAGILDQMFRIGGWQAASRGESNAGDPAAKVVALAKADDTVFGPMNRSYQNTMIGVLQKAHRLSKAYMQLPTIAKVAGEQMDYALNPWINREDLSEDAPQFRFTSSFGATPEALTQSLMTLVASADAAGNPLLLADEFWDLHPDPSLRPHRPNVKAAKRSRLRTINSWIEELCGQAIDEYADAVQQQPELGVELAQSVHEQITNMWPPTRTDDIGMCLESLDELVHDPTVPGLVRVVCELRQQIYFDWLAQAAAAAAQARSPGAMQAPSAPFPSGTGTPPGVSQFGGTPNSEAMSPGRLKSEVDGLAASAAIAGG